MNTNTIVRCGFIEDKDKIQLEKILKDNSQLKEIYIDVCSNNPFDCEYCLLLRRHERNVNVFNNKKNIILKTKDRWDDCIINILSENIKYSYFKKSYEGIFDFIINYQNIFYKITIFY